MLVLLLLLAYVLGVALTGGHLLAWTAAAAWWVITSSPYAAGVVVATLLGLGAALLYPRYRKGVSWRVARYTTAIERPPDGGSPVAAYLSELAADRWRDDLSDVDEPELAEVVELRPARRFGRAA